ncbi:carboxypeptidase-like regulatory domain-containing protein [Taibaiella koreensis]|uniref:carboxypeptidase-like regulatory domain-containing protein n=1 Tax=Taibaiella koreensis TaxID=1268548 RepID=UPI000E59C7A1|nr:carboxypeptidase-like regulatory domain-containing protein [Taibaiella koreensis]
MKTTHRVALPEPCSEDWEQMQPDGCGQFCGACSKTVIDFSTFSDDAFIRYFSADRTGICGRFSPHQLWLEIPLQQAQRPPAGKPWHKTLRYAFMGLLPLTLQAAPSTAQSQQQTPVSRTTCFPTTLYGTVVDEAGDALPGAAIQIEGTNNTTVSDAEGYFSITLDTNEGVLIFSAAGQITLTRKVSCTDRALTVQLASLSNELKEVVVQGLPLNPKMIMGSVSTIPYSAIAPRAMPTPNPFVILDGQPYADGLAGLAPSVHIVRKLMPAEATALYGTRAINGVVIAKTEKPSLWRRLTRSFRKKYRQ